ncbi:30S ribosomal protein S11 [Patescibacteria group bacterium]|nr:30S ribosomal protein S11 [Patescibacteria group bacterium]MBU4512923.1 30S ribosomal protein S11 [Patescibacteria group bacterium]
MAEDKKTELKIENKNQSLDNLEVNENKEDGLIVPEKKEGQVKIEKGKKGKSKKRKVIKMIKSGHVYVQASYNNTIITIADQNGNVISWASAGKCGFKGPKKATPYAAGIIVKTAAEKAIKERGLKEVYVFVKGVGAGREAAVRALNANGLAVLSIKDVTPTPHNGCRPPKVRRV